ncbi:MAG: energy transducer TonB [Sulfuritalea sp.]|nr:energy transducer TonB [Sulfuritalea sp.]
MNILSPHAAPNRLSPGGLGMVVALHLLVLWGLLRMNVITLPAPLAVLSVSLLPPAEVIQPNPEIVPPKPRPVERRPTPTPLPQPTQLAAPAEAPAPTQIAVPPAPTLAAPPVAAAPAQTQPRFDADYLDNPKPPYPSISRRMGEQGRVVLRVRVDAQGLPVDVQLHASSGSERLDASALQTVRRWKFVPARLGNEAVAATVLVPIAFSLKD